MGNGSNTKIYYHIVTQGVRVYYLKAPAPKRGFVKEELLISQVIRVAVCICRNTIRRYVSFSVERRQFVNCLLLVHIVCDA